MQDLPIDALHGREKWLRSARALLAYYAQKFNTPLELLTQAPQPLAQTHVSLPSFMHPFGVWGVKASRPVQDAETLELKKTFELVFGNGTLNLHPQKSQASDHQKSLFSNVIPLRAAKKPVSPFPAIKQNRWMMRQDCLIDSNSAEEIHKMAFELYAQGARYAFLEFKALDAQKRLELGELLRLGALVLYIPSLTELTLQEQMALNTMIEVSTLERPLLIVGTNVSVNDLRSDPDVHLPFLENLSRAYIKLSKPFSHYKREGLIQYFLDSLSYNPT